MSIESKFPAAIAKSFGERLKKARLNAGMTQVDVAEQAGISRKAVLTAEKGKAQLETLIAIMQALQLTDQLDNFLPTQDIPPIQLAKLQGRKRRRAFGSKLSSG
jgi:putative transcriptional regulator